MPSDFPGLSTTEVEEFSSAPNVGEVRGRSCAREVARLVVDAFIPVAFFHSGWR